MIAIINGTSFYSQDSTDNRHIGLVSSARMNGNFYVLFIMIPLNKWKRLL